MTRVTHPSSTMQAEMSFALEGFPARSADDGADVVDEHDIFEIKCRCRQALGDCSCCCFHPECCALRNTTSWCQRLFFMEQTVPSTWEVDTEALEKAMRACLPDRQYRVLIVRNRLAFLSVYSVLLCLDCGEVGWDLTHQEVTNLIVSLRDTCGRHADDTFVKFCRMEQQQGSCCKNASIPALERWAEKLSDVDSHVFGCRDLFLDLAAELRDSGFSPGERTQSLELSLSSTQAKL